jgi:hypothetical protein
MTSAARIATSRVGMAGLMLAVLGGCATAPPPTPEQPPSPPAASAPPAAPRAGSPAPPAAARTRYRCDHDLAFTVAFGDDAATLDIAGRGHEVLLRDAGGVTPQQTVYSNERVRAEFGDGAAGNEAALRFAEPALAARCTRE